MAKAFSSIVLGHTAAAVWKVIRPFDHYGGAGVEGETVIEDGKAGDQIGAVRRFTNGEMTIRQVLLAHSDVERSFTYAFCDRAPFPVQNYIATLRVAPVTADARAFVEWSATFDCAVEERGRWATHFEERGFATWLSALRRFMDAGRATGRGS
jgi:hypothetical protein